VQVEPLLEVRWPSGDVLIQRWQKGWVQRWKAFILTQIRNDCEQIEWILQVWATWLFDPSEFWYVMLFYVVNMIVFRLCIAILIGFTTLFDPSESHFWSWLNHPRVQPGLGVSFSIMPNGYNGISNNKHQLGIIYIAIPAILKCEQLLDVFFPQTVIEMLDKVQYVFSLNRRIPQHGLFWFGCCPWIEGFTISINENCWCNANC